MVELSAGLLLGKGCHKAVYLDPRNPKRCIKLLLQEPDIDWERERRYRHSRERRHLASGLLTEFYGTTETNLGTGYVFERVVDYDGQGSLDLKAFLDAQRGRADREAGAALALRVLRDFRERLFAERILTTDMDYENFLVQGLAPGYGEFAVRIIDNIGTHAKIPILFFVDSLALAHVRRYWHRLAGRIRQDYPSFFWGGGEEPAHGASG